MNFGSRYDRKIKQMGINPETITDIDEERTYKRYLNVTITYELNGKEIKQSFRAIQSEESLEEQV